MCVVLLGPIRALGTLFPSSNTSSRGYSRLQNDSSFFEKLAQVFSLMGGACRHRQDGLGWAIEISSARASNGYQRRHCFLRFLPTHCGHSVQLCISSDD